MKKLILISLLVAVFGAWITPVFADDDSIALSEEEKVKLLEMIKNFPDEYEKDPEKLMAVVDGGVPKGRWKEGLLFEGIEPMDWLVSAANWYPNTEELQPDEIRVTFMGTTPTIRPGQMNTSVFVELGNGKSFIFDIGEGSVSNYLASGIAFNEMNDIFITHLHVDHYNALAYVYIFGAWGGRWHEPLRVYGPSGRTDKDGISYMVEGMKMMTHWHRNAFSVFPIGRGWEVEVTEFPFMDDGGVVYDKDGVKVIHWRQSHAKDGASAYRLDWNGLSVAFTGDGRPNSLTEKYCKGIDLLITELQTEVVAISSVVQGVPPFLGRYTIDTHHNPAYAAGYLFNKVKPRLAMTTHMPFDPYINEETVAEVREHWKGPFHFGAPDMIVVNVTKDKIWVRDGVIPDYPNLTPPQAHVSIEQYGGLVVPVPEVQRKDIQEPTIREAEIDPALYYPKGYVPILMEDWPTDKPIFIPAELVPQGMTRRMKKK
jgi:ribonuclease Z